MARDGFELTCVNSSNKCDNNSSYETRDGNLLGKTFFSFRPQDSDSSRRILGWFNADYVEWEPKNRSMFTISPQYTRSFDTNGITQWFFFNGCDSMTVGIPSATQSFDIDGSQIGLSLGTVFDGYDYTVSLVPGKIGIVSAKPLAENYIVDLDYWCDLSSWHDNLWLRLECPIVYMITNMNMRAKGHGNQSEDYPTGLFTLESAPPDEDGNVTCSSTPVPYCSILCALEGNQGWGSVVPLESGKFSTKALHKWGVAGLHLDLGYDIWDVPPWYFAGSLHMVFPIGTRPRGTDVFEPVIGANKSWQVGATIIARYIKEHAHGECGIYVYAVGTHLFKSNQDRVFSLKPNGPGSQLLLLKQFNSAGTGLIDAEREANIFCGKTKIGAMFMFDGSLMFQYSRKRFVADLGYNFWVRTKERRANDVWFRKYSDTAYGIKGSLPMEDNVQSGCLYNVYPIF
jgi:hypothetical protein